MRMLIVFGAWQGQENSIYMRVDGAQKNNFRSDIGGPSTRPKRILSTESLLRTVATVDRGQTQTQTLTIEEWPHEVCCRVTIMNVSRGIIVAVITCITIVDYY
jgi:hypothetical protein